MPRHQKTGFFAYAKTKTHISFAVTAKLISAFVFATQIVHFLYYLNPKFQVSSHLLWLYSLVCVGPGRKPDRWFSHDTLIFLLLITYFVLSVLRGFLFLVLWISCFVLLWHSLGLPYNYLALNPLFPMESVQTLKP